MTLFATTVVSQNDHGYEAGRYVASQALAAFAHPPSLLIAFVSQHYQQPAEVARGIRSLAGSVPLIGCSGERLITMAGLLERGVVVLALRLTSSDACPGLVLESDRERASSSARHRSLAGSSSAAVTLLLEHARSARTATAATDAHTIGVSGCGCMCIDDQVADQGVAAALLPLPTAPGIGSGSLEAAQRAMAALGAPPAMALVCAASDTPLELDALREAVGTTTPMAGICTAALPIGPAALAADAACVVLCLGA